MIALQYLGGGLLICLGLYFIIMNWMIVAHWILYRRHSSSAPLVGGTLAAIGILVVPNSNVHAFWWVPLFLDWGCIPGFVNTLILICKRLIGRR